jgi:DNA-directed RNA polymerase subunit M/transcription elongation factor TFIIS
MIRCPKCQSLISFDNYFNAYVCNNCDYLERIVPKEIATKNSISESFVSSNESVMNMK